MFSSNSAARKYMLVLVALAVVLSADSFGSASADSLVQNETGFDGAVTVVKQWTEEDYHLVTVEIPYLDVYGKLKQGQGRLAVRRQELESGAPIPVFCHVHYEKNIKGLKWWGQHGWAVATAHYKEGDEGYPIDVSAGDGYNLAQAVIQWVRRLPFIDRTRMHIDGGSQGGYMALAMSANFLPVLSTTADFPVVNWAYNFSYFEVNKPISKFALNDPTKSPMPIMCSVTGLADATYKVFGNDLKSVTWYRLSPISYVDRITNPVLILCATGDMLVPMEQMTRERLRPYDKARFPEGYQRDFDTLTVCEPARKTFEELLPPDEVFVSMVPLQENSFEITYDMFTGKQPKPEKRPADMQRPWSDKHQWSLCYLDEGGPAPYGAHTSYEWAMQPDAFIESRRTMKPEAQILNAAKLAHLMQRYVGKLENPPFLADGTPANRLNFPCIEKRDVLTGLLDYASMGKKHVKRLKKLYRASELRPFGTSLGLDELRKELTTLGVVSTSFQPATKPVP